MANTELDLFGTVGQIWRIGKFLFKGAAVAGNCINYLAEDENKGVDEYSLPNVSHKLISHTRRGVVFGRKSDVYIIKPEESDGHVLVVGGVGSGKSSCIAIPTLRDWCDSVFAIDIKGELYEKSKFCRPNIKVFNPLDVHSYGYDPYYCLRSSRNPAQEARAIAQAVIPLPPETKDPFWIESAQNILTATILHCNAHDFSFHNTIGRMLATLPKDLMQILLISPVIEARYCVNSLAGMEERVISSIMAEISKNVVHFVTDKALISALSRKKNITPEDLEYGFDIYINIPEHLLRQWKSLLTLIVNQFLTHFEQRSEENAEPILFLLDEFPRLGKVGAMLDGLATLRSKKISICLIIQSLAQLDAIYGHNERKVIADICAYKAILGATDADTQEYFSRLVGTYDKPMTSHGTQNEAYTGLPKGTSATTYDLERRIIKPEEFGLLSDIVLLTPYGFYRVDKIPYYYD
ncbi:MAG: type IV secretory system conjugative DNA transfer family protein [Oscillospiraceae bacterium]|jgi:type IV secretion system protein VirD4|nr:type IV secretory system conjugative DNA transfer family protein [Oscillospiraceae bacterium]